jgi:MtfA peptidase
VKSLAAKFLQRYFGAPEKRIPDSLWDETLRRFAFLQQAESAQLRLLTEAFITRFSIAAVEPLVLTDQITVAIAAQACFPMLKLGLEGYRFNGVLVCEQAVPTWRSEQDEYGVVHSYEDVIEGELNGANMVMLAWNCVEEASLAKSPELAPYNLVIHEFMHVLDGADGRFDGVPPQANRAAHDRWSELITREFKRLKRASDNGFESYLDAYGCTDTAEFFSVAAEAYFTDRNGFELAHAELATLFQEYFRH